MKDVLSKDVLNRICGLAIALALALAFALTGCASDDNSKDSDQKSESTEQQTSTEQQAPETITVNMTVTDLDGNVLYDEAVEVEPESTILTVLEQSGVDYVNEPSSYGAYITSLAGVAGSDNSGWTYTVNSDQPPVSADQQEVVDGDVVAWQFITW